MTKALEKNHPYLEKTIELKKTVEGGFLVLAERLAKIRDEQMYAPEYESFPEFLNEMDLSEATASKLINIWNRLVLEYGIPKERLLEAGSWSSVSEILPYVKDKKTAENLLDKMTGLLPSDKRKVIRELRTGINQDDCKHGDWNDVHFRECGKCGYREKIYDN